MSTKSKLKFPKLDSQVIYNTFFHILCLKHLLLQSISVHSYGFVPELYILLIFILHIVSKQSIYLFMSTYLFILLQSINDCVTVPCTLLYTKGLALV